MEDDGGKLLGLTKRYNRDIRSGIMCLVGTVGFGLGGRRRDVNVSSFDHGNGGED
jgi:hypothetical protein